MPLYKRAPYIPATPVANPPATHEHPAPHPRSHTPPVPDHYPLFVPPLPPPGLPPPSAASTRSHPARSDNPGSLPDHLTCPNSRCFHPEATALYHPCGT